MTTLFVPPSDDGGTSPAKLLPPDDASDVTDHDMRNTSKQDCMRKEKTLRFRFAPTQHGQEIASPASIHTRWIDAVQDAFGSDVQILDNHSRLLPTIDPLCRSQTQHQQHFTLFNQSQDTTNDYTTATNLRFSSPTNNAATFIIHRIRTSLPPGNLRIYLKLENCLMIMHVT